jgi:hypothetical protein
MGGKIPPMPLSTLHLFHLLVAAVLGALLSAFVITQFASESSSFLPLQVVLYNRSGQMINAVTIEHGNLDTQEKIQAFQLAADQSRTLALNHEPGLGFNIDVNYADGKTVSACIGKFSDSYRLEVIIDQTGLHSEKQP